MGAEGELVDVVGEIECAVVEMCLSAGFHIAVSSSRDVEVTLDFVGFDAAVDATGVDLFAALEFGAAGEFVAAVFAAMGEDVVDMGIVLFGSAAAFEVGVFLR